MKNVLVVEIPFPTPPIIDLVPRSHDMSVFFLPMFISLDQRQWMDVRLFRFMNITSLQKKYNWVVNFKVGGPHEEGHTQIL